MTRITTGCPRCGRVELDIEDITLVLSPHEGMAWYFFDCQYCVNHVVKPAPTSVAAALSSVRVRSWTVPGEVIEREGCDDLPPLTVDDLLDALLWLRTGPAVDSDRTISIPSPGVAEPRPAHPNAA
jgi:hypothetical protein